MTVKVDSKFYDKITRDMAANKEAVLAVFPDAVFDGKRVLSGGMVLGSGQPEQLAWAAAEAYLPITTDADHIEHCGCGQADG